MPANVAFSQDFEGLVGQSEAFLQAWLCQHGVAFHQLGQLIVCDSYALQIEVSQTAQCGLFNF